MAKKSKSNTLFPTTPREHINGGQIMRTPMKVLIAASNELPAKDGGLEALWDRFLMRMVSNCIESVMLLFSRCLDRNRRNKNPYPNNIISHRNSTTNALQQYGSGVSVKRLRKNILGQCSFTNHLTLKPFLVIFKQEWMDGVILHEMAHYKYKHHRKSFWNFLSTLIGEDSKMAKVKDDIAISSYFNYYLYLTKN